MEPGILIMITRARIMQVACGIAACFVLAGCSHDVPATTQSTAPPTRSTNKGMGTAMLRAAPPGVKLNDFSGGRKQ